MRKILQRNLPDINGTIRTINPFLISINNPIMELNPVLPKSIYILPEKKEPFKEVEGSIGSLIQYIQKDLDELNIYKGHFLNVKV